MSGWFAMKRGIHDHPLFYQQPERLFVWSWILAKAAWADTRQDAGGQTVTVKRGQLLTSYRQISNATGVGVKAIRNLVGRLQAESAIDTDKGTGRLLITIRNYERYQSRRGGEGTGEGTARAQQGHTKETREQIPSSSLRSEDGRDAPIPTATVKVSILSSAVWNAGKPFLASRGVSNPGAMIGRWLKDHPPLSVLAAIEAAQRAGTQDAVPYITAALDREGGKGARQGDRVQKIIMAAAQGTTGNDWG
jgi:hypothetical protein